MNRTVLLAGVCLLILTVLRESDAQALTSRDKRHVDGYFTSELSKMRSRIAAREFLKSLGVSRRSEDSLQVIASHPDLSDFSASLEHSLQGMSPQKPSHEENVKATNKSGRNMFCTNWIHTKLFTKSLPKMAVTREELLATQVLCPIFTQMMGDMTQDELPLPPV